MNRVVIIDEHPLVRMAVRTLLEKAHYQVIAENNGEDAYNTIDNYYPGIIIIDIAIHSQSGLSLIKRVRNMGFPGIIIVVTAKSADLYAPRSAQAGANGYISKKRPFHDILLAITAAQNGYGFFPYQSHAIERVAPTADAEKLERLSAREFQVLQHILSGNDNGKIAASMHVSTKTVSTYKSRLMDKLECPTPLALFEFMRRNQLE